MKTEKEVKHMLKEKQKEQSNLWTAKVDAIQRIRIDYILSIEIKLLNNILEEGHE